MTAHLAVAQALGMQSKRGRDGALAMVLLTNFAGLQREALDRLDTFKGGHGDEIDFKYFHNTGDGANRQS